jgi:hypothetical protein
VERLVALHPHHLDAVPRLREPVEHPGTRVASKRLRQYVQVRVETEQRADDVVGPSVRVLVAVTPVQVGRDDGQLRQKI